MHRKGESAAARKLESGPLESALQDNEEFMEDDEGPNCFSFQYYGGDAPNDPDVHEFSHQGPPTMTVTISPKHSSGGNDFEEVVA